MGVYKAKKPMISKELVRPAPMIKTPTYSFKTDAFPQNAADTSSHPTVNGWKGPFVAVLEVLEPSPKDAIDPFDDHSQTVS